MPLTTVEKTLLFGLLYLGIYLFVIVVAVPIEMYLTNRIKNKIIAFVLTNIIGLILMGCMDIWFFTLGGFKSTYLIFPLFSILALIQPGSDAKGYN